jgi:hypothetical protein
MNDEFEITNGTKAVKTMEAKMETGTMETVKAEDRGQITENRNQKTIEKIYRYEDEKGKLLYEVIRYEPKGFSQRRPNGEDGYINNMQGVQRVLYKLPGLAGTPREIPVYIVEGEKDADRLWSLGLPATTNPGGAGKWLPEFNEYFRGRLVGILPDNDEAGRRHAQKVAESLCNVAACVKVVELPGLPPKGDVSDWLDPSPPNGSAVAGGGHKHGELSILFDDAPEFVLEEPWTRKADVVKMSEIEPEDVRWLWPERFPLGMITLLVGDPDLGKSYFSMYLASIVSNGGTWPDGTGCSQSQALILNAEDSLASTVRKRLHILGADADKIIAIRAMRQKIENGECCDHFNISDDRLELERVLKENPGVRLVIIDPLSAYFGNADTFKESTVRSILSPLGDLASRYNAAFVCIMHLNKGNSNKALYRTQGSLAFPAAARAVWLVSNDPENPESKRRFLINTKFNIGDKPSSLAFEIKDGKIVFESEPVNVTANDIFADKGGREAVALDGCIELIKETLGKIEKMTSNDLESICKNAGYKKSTYYQARNKAGVICWTETKQDGIKIYFVRLPKLKPPLIPGLEKQIEQDKIKIDKLKNQLSQACISP